MRNLAVDVALLPADDLLDAAVSLNRMLAGAAPQPIPLNRSGCLPHVTLAMACVAESVVPAIANELDAIAATHAPLSLIVSGLHVRRSTGDASVTSLELAHTPRLQGIHREAMSLLVPLAVSPASVGMFIEAESVSARTLRWVDDYATAASFERFWPHITLGMGTLPDTTRVPGHGHATRLALCHLGPHCTCRRVLFETRLRGG